MKKYIVIALIALLILPLLSSAQRWKRSRYEVIYGIGASNTFTDLGGNKDAGYLRDFEFKATRPSVFVGARFKLKELMAVKVNIINGWVKGSDSYTTIPTRANRQLSFYSPIIEFSTQFEYSIAKERFGTRYTFSNMRRFRVSNVNTYLFAGLGGFYFNPKVKQGAETSYRPATTQGVTSKGEDYSKVGMAFPIGIGFKYGVNRKLSLGVEISQRLTTTDYLDNHSDKFSTGRDAYNFIHVSLSYKLRTARSGLPKF